MGETKFTRGPWAWDKLTRRLSSAHGLVIDHAAYEGMWFATYDPDQDDANAHLIAAAPTMYEALAMALDHLLILYPTAAGDDGLVDACIAALARARGEGQK